jgi:hypothetical protein
MIAEAGPKGEELVSAVLSYRMALSAVNPSELARSERAVIALYLKRANGMMQELGLARPAKAKTIRSAMAAVSRLANERGKYAEVETELENLVGLAGRKARGLYLQNPSSNGFTVPLIGTGEFLGRISNSGAFRASEKLFSLLEKESSVLSRLSDPAVLKESIDSIRKADELARKAKTLSEIREAESIVRGLRSAGKIDLGLEKRMISNIESKRKTVSAGILQKHQKKVAVLPSEASKETRLIFAGSRQGQAQDSLASGIRQAYNRATKISELREAEAMVRGFHYDGLIGGATAEILLAEIDMRVGSISAEILQKANPPKN